MHSYIIKLTTKGADGSRITFEEALSAAIREKTGCDKLSQIDAAEESVLMYRVIPNLVGGAASDDGKSMSFSGKAVWSKAKELMDSAVEYLEAAAYGKRLDPIRESVIDAILPDRGICFLVDDAPMNKFELLSWLHDTMVATGSDEVVLGYAGALDYHA